jgi:uncharacterized membrane protein YraQ (UPF0718 family)
MHGSKTVNPKAVIGYLPFFAFLLAGILSHFGGWKPGIAVFSRFGDFVGEMILFLPLVFMIIGLIDAWIPREAVMKRLGEGSGSKGAMWVIILAMLFAGPLYAAFPVALMLRKKGCSIRNVFIYLGAFSAMKIPMVSFEIGFLGLKFSLLRLAFTLPVFIIIGILMENIMGAGYEMPELMSAPEEGHGCR